MIPTNGAGTSPKSGTEFRGPVGLVLCGGESRRMGRDKALLRVGGETLLERAVAGLAGAASPVLLASGSRPRYARLGLEEVCDSASGRGPLAGLEAGLARALELGAPGLIAVACDMPRLRPELLAALWEEVGRASLDACLLRSEGGIEPLCAAYRTTCLPAVRSALATGERRMVAFHRGHGGLAIGGLAAEELSPDLGGADVARNVNTPDELRREREAIA